MKAQAEEVLAGKWLGATSSSRPAPAAIPTCRRWGDKQQTFMSSGSGGQKSELEVLAGVDSPEAPRLGLQMAAFSLCFVTLFVAESLCALCPTPAGS